MASAIETTAESGRARMDIVIVGHVDHGKSTVVGRLLADTGTLPDGKLESIRAYCAKNARPFEYAFLLDALKDEQAQGITIDTARTFFKSAKRDYVIIDAPGHIEFLKNMVTGAARAEAAVLVIDAKEGIRENSKRHGYLLSMLGIRQIAVAVNKMDLVDYSREIFEDIRDEYTAFLGRIGATPRFFLPLSAFHGENLIGPSDKMPWFKGHSLLSAIDAFKKEPPKNDQSFRMPVQDVYKFTALGDDRRIIAGRVESGSVRVGDEVVFLPSGKRNRIKSVEGFNAAPASEAVAGSSTGFTLHEQIYVGRGELMVKASESPASVSRLLRANLFWMGKRPFEAGKTYFLKLGTAKIPVRLRKINFLIDASETDSGQAKEMVEKHAVADCVLELSKPLAFDRIASLEATGRFVIVDQYEIAGGGIIRESLAEEAASEATPGAKTSPFARSPLPPGRRAERLGQKAALILVSGGPGRDPGPPGEALEAGLLEAGRAAYFLGWEGSQPSDAGWEGPEALPELGQLASFLLDAGLLLVIAAKGLDSEDVKTLEGLVSPHPLLTLEAPADAETSEDQTGIVKEALERLRHAGSIP